MASKQSQFRAYFSSKHIEPMSIIVPVDNFLVKPKQHKSKTRGLEMK